MAAAYALAIISGKIILNFGFLKSLRTFQKPFFHERGRNGKRQLPRLLPAEAAALRARFCWLNPFRHRLRRCHLPQGDGFSCGG